MKNHVALITFFILLFIPASFLFSQGESKDIEGQIKTDFDKVKLDNFLSLLEEHEKFMGSLALSYKGKLIYSNAVGFADVKEEIKSSTDTKYRVGSISKMFTAALIFQAVENEKIQLDQTIDAYFPELPNAKKITVSNLLNHRSGIYNFTNEDDYLKYNTQEIRKQDLLTKISSFDTEFEPDTEGDYSNSNYILLTLILEEVYGSELAELVKNRICRPLGLENTYYGGKTITENQECYSYRHLVEWKKEPETNMSVPLGAGAIVSQPEDLLIFIEALFSGEIVSSESIAQMQEIKDGYGRGLFSFPFEERTSYGHPGGIDGFVSFLAHFPEEDLSIALCSNGDNYGMNTVVKSALNCFFKIDFELPVFSKLQASSADLAKYAGRYSSEQMSLKITISQEGNNLLTQATGQPKVALQYDGENRFSFEQVDAKFEFHPESESFVLTQRGESYHFKKENIDDIETLKTIEIPKPNSTSTLESIALRKYH